MPDSFPASLLVKTLLQTHLEYDAGKLALFNALYEGGEAFRAKPIMKQMLIKRQIEYTSEGAAQWERRCERAGYINRAGGLIDWFVASVFPEPLLLQPTGLSEESTEYWDGLNLDADGAGTPFGTLCRNALQEMLVNRRPYFKLHFPESNTDARWSLLHSADVDDWLKTPEGALSMARVRGCDPVRSTIFDQPDKERWTWTYYTAQDVAIYEAEKKIGETWRDEDKATLAAQERHDFKAPPLFDIRASRAQWAMARIYDVIRAVFNREAAITWALDMQAYAQPVLKTQDGRVVSIYGNELFALRLIPGEAYEYATPPANIFDPLFKDAERLRDDFHSVIQAMAINAAAIPQAGRLSGDAVSVMREPLQRLLESFAWPVREAAQRAVTALAEYRDEDPKSIELVGFDRPAEAKMDDVDEALNGKGEEDGEGNAVPEGGRGKGSGARAAGDKAGARE
jgi:hypothetical protein